MEVGVYFWISSPVYFYYLSEFIEKLVVKDIYDYADLSHTIVVPMAPLTSAAPLLRPLYTGIVCLGRATSTLSRARIPQAQISVSGRQSFKNRHVRSYSQNVQTTSQDANTGPKKDKPDRQLPLEKPLSIVIFLFWTYMWFYAGLVHSRVPPRWKAQKELPIILQSDLDVATTFYTWSDPDFTELMDGCVDFILALEEQWDLPRFQMFKKSKELMAELNKVIDASWEEPILVSTRKKWALLEPHFERMLDLIKFAASKAFEKDPELADRLEAMHRQLDARAMRKGGAMDALLYQTKGGHDMVKAVARLFLRGQEKNRDYYKALEEIERFLWHKIRDDYTPSKIPRTQRNAEQDDTNGSVKTKSTEGKITTEQSEVKKKQEGKTMEEAATPKNGTNGEKSVLESDTKKQNLKKESDTPSNDTQQNITDTTNPPEKPTKGPLAAAKKTAGNEGWCTIM